MNSKKRKRHTLSLETKIKILDRIKKGDRYAAIGRDFKLGESSIRAIKKNEDQIRKSVVSGTDITVKYSSYSRDPVLEKMERALMIWIGDLTSKSIPVSGYVIVEKALKFYHNLKQLEPSTSTSHINKPFSASKGWLSGFLKRN